MRYRTAEYGPVMIRIGLGIVYFVHGLGKLLGVGPTAVGVGGFSGFLGQLGVPAPVVFAWVVALVETVGGLALLLGILTRFAAALIAVDALVATLLVHLPAGFVATEGGYEFTFVLLLAALSLVLTGPGALSLERTIRGEEYLPKQLRAPG